MKAVVRTLTLGVLAALLGTPAWAGGQNVDERLRRLEQRLEEQQRQLEEQMEEIKAQREQIRAQRDEIKSQGQERANVEKQESVAPVVTLDAKGFNVKSQDGRFGIKIGARLHVQASGNYGDLPDGVDATDGTELRRARLELKGKFYEDWKWSTELDFADNEVAIKDFWLAYEGLPWASVSVGHQKQPYSLSIEMSSNDIPFIERSIDAFLLERFVDRAIGVRTQHSGEHWFAAAGVYGESVDPNKDDDEGWGLASRFIYTPILSERRVLHLGGRVAYREPSPGKDDLRIKDETTHHSNLAIVDTGDLANVDSATLVGPEFAVAVGPFSLFGEYNKAFIDRSRGSDYDFDSWHVAGTWTMTGESRAAAYKMSSGEFKRLTGDTNFSLANRTWGAWELAGRLAGIHLNDGSFKGGDEMVWTTGLNWYLNPSVRLMFEWSRIVDTDNSSATRRDANGMDIVQGRVQFVY